ncbi:hypothetical protein BLA24_31010 [Streptomyces cinnamoneus]|uniref:Uncharacterized protein n=1 Tax=Streptomyces cinnamoneus TaxID=53446 RepID=A0A2G1X9N3_STRCJ|nr:aminotransferase class IV [Streptomyces cinnamoneus]PHQ47932.1 hypothetical protein BLA24_31010 [Streptomyces cinnamoneus]PPT15557.1 aminotransferase class IV [Streptomyces cinnamoneus]
MTASPPAASPVTWAYHDGGWTDVAAASVPVGSLAMRYALSVFEGVRMYRQHGAGGVVPFLLDAHVRRLGDSLTLTRIPDPGIARLPSLVGELARRNGFDDDVYVRVAVSAHNQGTMGADVVPVLTVTGTPMGRKRWLAGGFTGMRLQISGWQRGGPNTFPPAAKNISNYAGPRLALLAAKDGGYDNCVLLNEHGRLCEAPTAALFVVRDGELHTPALSEGVLPGITRQWVLDTARRVGVPAREGLLSRGDAYLADEAFLCGTGLEIAPVRSFDDHPCRHWPDAPVTRAFTKHFFDQVRGLDSPADPLEDVPHEASGAAQ